MGIASACYIQCLFREDCWHSWSINVVQGPFHGSSDTWIPYEHERPGGTHRPQYRQRPQGIYFSKLLSLEMHHSLGI